MEFILLHTLLNTLARRFRVDVHPEEFLFQDLPPEVAANKARNVISAHLIATAPLIAVGLPCAPMDPLYLDTLLSLPTRAPFFARYPLGRDPIACDSVRRRLAF